VRVNRSTEEQNAFTYHRWSFSGRFWPYGHGFDGRIAGKFNRHETNEHSFTHQRSALLGALPP